MASGTPVPAANIIVYVTSYAPITSRIFEPNTGLSDALLLVDEPGSSQTTGAVGNYGPQAPQVLCTLTPAGCPAYSELDQSGKYPVAASEPAAGSPNAANVFQGFAGEFGANSVTFYGVPAMAPAYRGLSRVYRITNIRVPIVGLAEGTQVAVILSTNPSTVMPLSGSFMTAGVVQAPMTASVNSSPPGGNAPFPQCMPPAGPALSAQINFTEGFQSMFKTRVAPLANTAWASTATNTGTPGQNIPGGQYNGFAADSESGFILPASAIDLGTVTYTAGLSDFGTRLKAVFTNIPAGLLVYVSTTNAANYAAPGGTNVAPYAVLVATDQSHEADEDAATVAPLTGGVPGSDGLTAYPLTVDATGRAAAIWEVVDANPQAIDTLTFSVYVTFSGLPSTNAFPGLPVNNVALSFAPEPGGGTFTNASGASALASPVPRFNVLTPQEGSWFSISPCAISVYNAPNVPFIYAIGGALPANQSVIVVTSPSGLGVMATPQVNTPTNGNWLSASYNGLLSIWVNPAGLAESSTPYMGSVVLSASGVPSVAVPVSLMVYPAPSLAVTKTHVGDFTAGQVGATYSVTVSNAASSAATSGTVTVTEQVPGGLTLVAMAGSGWNCSSLPTCQRSDALPGGASYPPIAVTVNVSGSAPSQVTNQVSASGGGSVSASAGDLTNIVTAAPILSITKTHSGSFTQGENGAGYTISVSNAMAARLVATPATVNLDNSTCNSSQPVVVTSSGPPIDFQFRVQYPDGANPNKGDANGAWLSATMGNCATSSGAWCASSTGANGVNLTIMRFLNMGAAMAQAWVVLTPVDATIPAVIIPVTYTQSQGATCPSTLSDFAWATPASISLTGALGSQQSQILSLQNPSGSPFSVSVSASGGSWLSVNPSSTTVPSYNNTFQLAYVMVTADASKVSAIGTLNGTVTISGNGSSVSVPVTFVVTPGPTAGWPPQVTPGSLAYQFQEFSTYSGQEAQTLLMTGTPGTEWTATFNTATINNGTWLQFDSGYFGTGVFGTGPSSLVVDLSDYFVVYGGQTGAFTGTVTITSAGGTTTVPVSLLVTTTPVLFASPAQAIFYSTNGSTPSPQTVTITGSDNPSSPPTIAAGTPTAAWIQAQTSGNTMTVTVDPTGLPTGIYSRTVSVSSSAYANPVSYAVLLVVNDEGTGGPLTLGPASLTFSDVAATGSQNLNVTAPEPTNFQVAAFEQTCGGNTWLSVSPSGSLTASSVNTPLAVMVNRAGITTGTLCSGTISFLTASGVQTVGVVLEVGTPGPTSGLVTVTESMPQELTLVSMAGTGWDCSAIPSCTRSDSLAGGAAYPPIVVTANVPADAPAQVTNQASVSWGGSGRASATDITAISPFTCTISGDQNASILDVQVLINQALGLLPPANDLNHDGVINLVDVAKLMGAVVGNGCPF
jgi:hypothetical protein